MGLYDIVKEANRPGPPEDSVSFRVATVISVCVGIAACWSEHELSPGVAGGSIFLIVVGNIFSYLRRNKPFPLVKAFLALAVVGAFLWFFSAVSGNATVGNILSVEGPLAVLFTVIQVTHAFDVPSRRDLGFTLAGSATLMAVGAAQALNNVYAIFVVLWAAAGLVGLLFLWNSMAGKAGVSWRTIFATGIGVVLIGLGVVAALPAPNANSKFVLPSSLANDISISQPGGLVGGGANGTEPAHAAPPTSSTGVGGFLGFAGPLTTALRGGLSDEVVFRVRADRPSYWVAQTYNSWNGQSWSEVSPNPKSPVTTAVQGGSPFYLPQQPYGGTPDYQTFYLALSGPNLIFHADNAKEVWFPSSKLYVGQGGTIRTTTSMGPGSIYTVLSTLNAATPAQLESAKNAAGGGLNPKARAALLQLPYAYPQVQALAKRLTAHVPTLYGKIQALETWMGTHTKYTLTIPPLKPGQNTVDQFLFGSRRGFCEQISTSLVVMLRSIGIPAEEAAGYVPGTYDPITDLYQEEAKDAHSWVQVWFPGYGWQSFDPTADVPFANPTPGGIIGHDIVAIAKEIPLVPTLFVIALAFVATYVTRRRRRIPKTFQGKLRYSIERAAKTHNIAVDISDPLIHVASQFPQTEAKAVALLAEEVAYGKRSCSSAEEKAILKAARHLRKNKTQSRK